MAMTVAEYEREEEAALRRLPRRAVQASGTLVFDRLGYPTRVRSDAELPMYCDAMHETRFAGVVDRLLGGLTESELTLAVEVLSIARRWLTKAYGVERFPTAGLARAFLMLRNIQWAVPERKARVFEVGAGSGWLGALLLARGHKYGATDPAQAFYLWQDALWERFGHAEHIPWWEYVRMWEGGLSEVDLVTANHAISEMEALGRDYFFTLAARMAPAVVFEGWGLQYPGVMDKARGAYQRAGWQWIIDQPTHTVLHQDYMAGTQLAGRITAGWAALGPRWGSVECAERLAKAAGVKPKEFLTPDERWLGFIGKAL